MSTYTPGPWKVDVYGDVVANGEDVARIATTDCGYHDALLIAAAPELLEALVLALPYVTDAESFPEHFKPGVVNKHVRQIRAAIAKAEGREQ